MKYRVRAAAVELTRQMFFFFGGLVMFAAFIALYAWVKVVFGLPPRLNGGLVETLVFIPAFAAVVWANFRLDHLYTAIAEVCIRR